MQKYKKLNKILHHGFIYFYYLGLFIHLDKHNFHTMEQAFPSRTIFVTPTEAQNAAIDVLLCELREIETLRRDVLFPLLERVYSPHVKDQIISRTSFPPLDLIITGPSTDTIQQNIELAFDIIHNLRQVITDEIKKAIALE